MLATVTAPTMETLAPTSNAVCKPWLNPDAAAVKNGPRAPPGSWTAAAAAA
jgi:hypothetical protein